MKHCPLSLPDEIPMSVQEREYSSRIQYEPRGSRLDFDSDSSAAKQLDARPE
jgi:hypothetical protein